MLLVLRFSNRHVILKDTFRRPPHRLQRPNPKTISHQKTHVLDKAIEESGGVKIAKRINVSDSKGIT
jgi:hypothetical protein